MDLDVVLRLVQRVGMRLSRTRHLDGVWIGIMGIGDQSDDHLLDRVEEAMRLIKTHDPSRYRRIIRDLDRIWITVLTGSQGEFIAEFRRCDIEERFVASESPENIASVIVHEATHAHPCLVKIGYPEALRLRIEKICLRQELAFLDRLPGGGEARRDLVTNLLANIDHYRSFWTDKEHADRQPARMLEAMKYIKTPDWLAKAVIAAWRRRERSLQKRR